MPIYEFEGHRPKIGANTFVHPTASIIGNVTIGERCFIGPGASLRGDNAQIIVGDGTNIQDNCILHGNNCILGPNCHLGHGAIVHGATLGEGILVGINAIVLDRAVIGDGCIIGAGAVVAPRAEVPPGKLLMGVPAAIVEDVSPERAEGRRRGTLGYQELAQRYLRAFKEIPLEEIRTK